MRPETAVALALLKLDDDSDSDLLGFRSDVVACVHDIRISGNVDVPGVRILSRPDGELNSAEVSNILGRLASTGYMKQESPIRLTEDGRDLLMAHVRRYMGEDRDCLEVHEAGRALGLDVDEVVGSASEAEQDPEVVRA